MNFGEVLDLSFKHPMVFNGNKSSIQLDDVTKENLQRLRNTKVSGREADPAKDAAKGARPSAE